MAVALLLAGLPIAAPGFAPRLEAAAAPPYQATVARIENSLDVKSAGSSKWRAAHLRAHLNGGDYANTDAKSSATLLFRDGMRLDMNHNTDVIVRNPKDVHISAGELYERVPAGKGKRNVNTGNAVASVEGTKFDVKVEIVTVGGRRVLKTTLTVVEHKVRFHNRYGTVLVRDNQQSVVLGDRAPTPPVTVDARAVVRWARTVGYSPQLAYAPHYPTAVRRRAAVARAVADEQVARNLFAAHLALADAAADEGRAAEARVEYGRALALAPQSPAALLGLAQALVVSGQPAAAARLYVQARRLAPMAALPILGLGHVALLGDDPDTAARLYRAAARLAPSDPYIPFALGQALITLGDYTGAVLQEQRALALAPTLAGPAVALGDAYALQGNAAPSVAAFRRALRADPRLWVAWNDLGIALNLQGQATEAVATMKTAVGYAGTPYQRSLSLGFLASLLTGLGRSSEALPYALRATTVDPTNAQALYALGDLYAYGVADYPRAEAALRLALRRDPASASVWATLGQVYARLKRYDQAIAAVHKAMALAPTYVYPRTLLGEIYTEKGDPRRALVAFKAAAEALPGSPEAWVEYGVGLNNVDESRSAIQVLRRSIALLPPDSPSSATAYGYLAATYANLGDSASLAQGLAAGQQGVRLNPSDDIALANLGLVYLDLARYADAATLLTRALAVAPRESDYWQLLAQAYHFMIKYQPALTAQRAAELGAAQQAVAVDQADSGAWYSLGVARQDSGAPSAQALAAFQRSVALNPRNAGAWLELGRIDDLQLARWDQAIVALRKALAVNGADPATWYYLGDSYYKLSNASSDLGGLANAVTALTHALDDPENGRSARTMLVITYGRIIGVYLRRGAYPQALRWSARLTNVATDLGYYWQGYTFQQMGGHRAQALAAYHKALAAARKDHNTTLAADIQSQIAQLK